MVKSRHHLQSLAVSANLLSSSHHIQSVRTLMSYHGPVTPRRVDDIFSPVASSSRSISTALARIPFASPYLPSSSGRTSGSPVHAGPPRHPAHHTTTRDDNRLQTPQSRSAPSPNARFCHRRPPPPVSPRSPIDQEADSPEYARVERGKIEEPLVIESGDGTRVYIGRALFERHW